MTIHTIPETIFHASPSIAPYEAEAWEETILDGFTWDFDPAFDAGADGDGGEVA